MSDAADSAVVFVVHGRNRPARDAMFAFLRALGLKPLEWAQAVKRTGTGAPYIGEILDRAFEAAQAVVVLLTPDEIAYLRTEYAEGDDDPDAAPNTQARPNVLFEAGMAFGRHPERTILVELGKVRGFSDVAGRHAIRLDNSSESRKDLAERLRTAGCSVDTAGSDWLKAGDLTPPTLPGEGLPLGKRLPSPPSSGLRLDARYVSMGGGKGRLLVTNYSSFAIHDVVIELPPEAGQGFWLHAEPVKKLPSGKTASFIASRTSGGGSDHFEITISGKTPEGEPVSQEVFISLAG